MSADDTDAAVARVVSLIRNVPACSASMANQLLADLSSLEVVELIVRLEKQFGCALDVMQIEVEDLRSVSSITATIEAATSVSRGVHTYSRNDCVVPRITGTIVDVLRRRAATQPDAPFITWMASDDEVAVLSYGELERRSTKVAAGLMRRVPERGRVALLATNEIDTVVGLVAAIRAGMTCGFFNPSDPLARLQATLEAYQPDLVLRPAQVRHLPATLATPVSAVAAGDSRHPREPVVNPSDPAFVFSTSGSTATGKLVVQSHRAALSNASAITTHLGLDLHTTLMGGLPLHHVNGVHFTVLAALHAGAHTVLPRRFSALSYCEQMAAAKPDVASVVPSMLEALLATGRGWRPPASLRHFVSAAAPLTASLARRVHETFGTRVIQGYGLTETTNFSTMLPTDLPDSDYAALTLDATIPSIGISIGGNDVDILSADGSPVADDVVGELCVCGDSVMDGYLASPTETATALRDGWFRTGDLGRRRTWHDGRQFFFITGRLKNIAKVAGESVSLEAIERELVLLDGVIDAGCAARPSQLWGEEIAAFVQLGTGDIAYVRAEVALRLPAAAVPRLWFAIDVVPRTTTGKLRRGVLQERLAQEPQP